MAHNKEDARWLGPSINLRDDDVEKLDGKYIVLHVRQTSKDCNFSVNSLHAVDAVKSILDVFYGHGLICSFLDRFDNLSKASLALYAMELEGLLKVTPNFRQFA